FNSPLVFYLPGELLCVELDKERQGLGLSLAGNRDRSRLMVRGGAAELDGRLMQGDQILSVNGDDTRHASQETVAAILKRGTVTLDVLLGLGDPLSLPATDTESSTWRRGVHDSYRPTCCETVVRGKLLAWKVHRPTMTVFND
uniref:PDZ domain-containing protein n=1 Tax=Seriola lalandi dorsalis TaxID=1841481 RepID=A0A3B4Y463_SERLL